MCCCCYLWFSSLFHILWLLVTFDYYYIERQRLQSPDIVDEEKKTRLIFMELSLCLCIINSKLKFRVFFPSYFSFQLLLWCFTMLRMLPYLDHWTDVLLYIFSSSILQLRKMLIRLKNLISHRCVVLVLLSSIIAIVNAAETDDDKDFRFISYQGKFFIFSLQFCFQCSGTERSIFLLWFDGRHAIRPLDE